MKAGLYNIDGTLELIDYDNPKVEKRTVVVTRETIQPGWICYDLGANIGFYTFLLAQLAGTGGVVYAFEPLEAPREALHRALPQWQVGWAEIGLFECGLSDTVCEKRVRRGTDWELLDGGDVHCFFDTIDNLLATYPTVFRPPNFMKIDIDGYESRMLRGARKTLTKHKPFIVIELAETAHEHHGQDVRDAIKVLLECGYKIYHEDTNADLVSACDGSVDKLVQLYVPKGGSINVVAKAK